MTTPEDREREFQLRQAELEAKERELRLREIETEIYHEQKTVEVEGNSEPPLYRTSKHNPPQTSIQKLTKKTIKFAKFGGFVVVGIAVITVGIKLGMWIAYAIMAAIIGTVGYQIFLKGDE